LQTKRRSRRLNCGQPSNLWYPLLRTVDDRDTGNVRSDFLKYLWQLAAHGEFADREACDVAAGLGEAGNEAASDRIANTHKHNWNCVCYLLQRRHGERPIGKNNVRLAVGHFYRGLVDAADVGRGPMHVDLNIASVDPA
jgi:hypothetical protein